MADIADFAAPLSPFRSIEEMECARSGWVAGANVEEMLELMFDVLVNPPSDEEIRVCGREDFEFELRQMLGRLGQRSRQPVLAAMKHWLDDHRTRETAINTLGELKGRQELPWLAPLVRDPTLSETEAISLADALWEIEGPEALALLEILAVHAAAQSPEAQEEIRMGRGWLSRRLSP